MKKFIPIDGMPVNVTDEVYYTYYKMKRYEKTLEEKDARNRVIHYDAWDDGHLIFSSRSPTPEETVIEAQMVQALRKCLAQLPDAEHDLIHALFFEGKAVAALSEQLSIPKRTLGCRRDKILQKLRKMLVSSV